MKTVIYADVYFLLNFSIDLICITLCGAIAGRVRRKLPICIAASVGGLYACLSLLMSNGLLSLVSSVFVCALMYFIAFSPKSFGGVIYGSILLFCVNAMFGGLYSAIVSLASGGVVNTDRFVFYPLFLTVTASLIFARLINLKTGSCELITEVVYKGKTARFVSMIDSGNSLREPISGAGVALLSLNAAKRIFSDAEISLLMGDEDLTKAFAYGFRLITLSTAVGSKKCFCTKPEKVFIDNKRKKEKVSVYFTVSLNFNLGDVECLLPNSLNIKF